MNGRYSRTNSNVPKFQLQGAMEMAAQRTMTYGVVVGNRGFFPDHLAKTGREEMIATIEGTGGKAIVLTAQESKFGAVETFGEARHCAELFKKHAAEIDGI